MIRLKARFTATLTKRFVQVTIVMLHKMGFQPAVHGLLTVKREQTKIGIVEIVGTAALFGLLAHQHRMVVSVNPQHFRSCLTHIDLRKVRRQFADRQRFLL
ncbi:hypothetical protein [Vibrio coralliilyticus]|uniref:hypothetical protein n=1 Tax=Vibrio coralliilyticus TaxID=190893 RepID=UPI001D0D45AA|nr:hypothetical protein [Vibrio coralliilyticus]